MDAESRARGARRLAPARRRRRSGDGHAGASAIPKADGAGKLNASWLPTIPITHGGTGATDIAQARTNLGVDAAPAITSTVLTLAKATPGGVIGSITISNTGRVIGYTLPAPPAQPEGPVPSDKGAPATAMRTAADSGGHNKVAAVEKARKSHAGKP